MARKSRPEDTDADAAGESSAFSFLPFGLDGLFDAALPHLNPAQLLGKSLEFSRDMADIASGKSERAPNPRDARFKDEVWATNPVYKRVAQAYLAATDAIEKSIPEELDGDDRARALLACDIMVSSMSPTNTLAGNPAAMQKAFETGGESLVKGMRNFVDDLVNNGGMPRQVDDSGFKVGENLAVTPGKVVHRTDMFELIQYSPTCDTVHQIPVLLIPPQIGRYYFTDLAPGRSFAEYAVSQGLNHFVVSWRNPGPDQRDWGLEDYAAAALDAIEAVTEIAGCPKINLIAFCAGGILAALASAVLAAWGRDTVNTLALCVTMLDWEADAMIGGLRLPAMLGVARKTSAKKGILPSADLHKLFSWLRPNDLVWNYWVNNYLMGEKPAAFDILAWNNDGTNLPAHLHEDFMNIFENNPLIRPGELEVLGEKIDLGKIVCDTFIVGAQTDHLTPWKACYRSCNLLGGSSTFALSNGGHVAALVNPPTNPKAYHIVAPGTAGDADAWEQGAVKHPGSWWQGWAAWAAERSGERVKAPRKPGSKKFAPVCDAPGTYVFG